MTDNHEHHFTKTQTGTFRTGNSVRPKYEMVCAACGAVQPGGTTT